MTNCFGLAFTVIDLAALMPQPFTAFTDIDPVPVKEFPYVTIILVLPWPEFKVTPEGTVQKYEVAPKTGFVLYCKFILRHTPSVCPLMARGDEGIAETVYVLVFAILLPQLLLAVTLTMEAVVELLKLTLIDKEPCPELIVPPGPNVHV